MIVPRNNPAGKIYIYGVSRLMMDEKLRLGGGVIVDMEFMNAPCAG
jgi:hypothetical protein